MLKTSNARSPINREKHHANLLSAYQLSTYLTLFCSNNRTLAIRLGEE